MTREARMVQLGKQVAKAAGVQPLSDPIAAGSAVASIYAQSKCEAKDALDYLKLLAEAASRLQDSIDPDEMLCRVSAACGSSLRSFGEEFVLSFLNPALSGERYDGTVLAKSATPKRAQKD